MTNIGPGILAIWNDVAPGRDADFNEWFQSEHLAERLAVPGFLFGRRSSRRGAMRGAHVVTVRFNDAPDQARLAELLGDFRIPKGEVGIFHVLCQLGHGEAFAA